MATNGYPIMTSKDVERAAKHIGGDDAKVNNWSFPGPAAYDFRSDVVTTPTSSMFTAIASTTLLDDVFVEDPTTKSLESFIASLTGHPSALLVVSGTMGNQVALRTLLLAPPHSVLCDHRSHILEWEAGGVASLSGALVKGVVPENKHHITLEDVKRHAVVSEDVHSCPTAVISLENTLNGTILPLKDCEEIATWARERGIKMHLDGARLWEAVAAGAGSLKDYCACFDTVSLCFSKGLGAPVGSIIVGSEAVIKRARWVRKSIGGGLRQSGVIAAPARIAVEETFLGGLLTQSHENARRVAKMWESMGGELGFPVETNMVWIDLEGIGKGWTKEKVTEAANRRGLRFIGGKLGRLVVHYQISEDAITRLEGLFKELLGKEGEKQVNGVGRADATAEDLDVKVE